MEHMHSNVIRAAKDPNCTHLEAVADLKEEIVRKNPNAHDDDDRNTGRVKQTATKKHQNYEHQNQAQGGKNHHPDAKTIALKNGKKLKCHHSFRFDDNDFRFFAHQQKKTLFDERQAANPNSNSNRDQGCGKSDDWKKESKQEGKQIVQSLMSQLKESRSLVSDITQQNDIPPDLPSSIMGGHDSQDKRNRNQGGRTE